MPDCVALMALSVGAGGAIGALAVGALVGGRSHTGGVGTLFVDLEKLTDDQLWDAADSICQGLTEVQSCRACTALQLLARRRAQSRHQEVPIA